MPKVSITRPDGVVIQADVSFEEFKELAGLNGHKRETPSIEPPAKRRGRPPAASKDRDVHGFLKSISPRVKTFISVLKANPDGIEGNDLAPQLGFQNANQIGGLTGPMMRVADRYGIAQEDIYRSEALLTGNQRRRMFYPGKLTLEVRIEQDTPLFKRGA
jgi:hypothetical protein